jgi:hypothetical protein
LGLGQQADQTVSQQQQSIMPYEPHPVMERKDLEPQQQPVVQQQPLGGYDLSALEAIPTPGAKASPETEGFMKRMAQSADQPPAAPSQPQAPAPRGQYDLSALEAIPTPQPKPPESPISQRLKVPTGESPNPQQRLRGGMGDIATPVPSRQPAIQPQAPQPVMQPPASPQPETSYANAPMIPDESPPERSFPMQTVAGVLILLTVLLAAFTVPNMIKQSMKPANVEADMSKSKIKSFTTDQLKEKTPYVR